MFVIRTYNAISPTGLARFDSTSYTVSSESSNPSGVLLRSYKLTTDELPSTVVAVARAGAGTNNIPTSELTGKGIVVFNTPGANANAVKELICAGLMMSSRDIFGGLKFVDGLSNQSTAELGPLLESEKKRFAGTEVYGKTLGIVGLGAIGSLVANMALDLGMRVVGYDPAISVEAAWRLSSRVEKMSSLDALLKESDYITLHVPAIDVTKGMINSESMSRMKPGVKLLNFSRKEIVNASDLIAALDIGKIGSYVTDFPTPELIGHPKVLAMPHIGASTGEAEDNCAVMAADQLINFLENGNIKNSVNFPDTSMARGSEFRLTFSNSNVPNVLSAVLTQISATGANVIDLVNQSRNEIAYNIMDIDQPVTDELVDVISNLDGVIRVRRV
ncbi:phosphoglycerate dehydrogenase [Litoricolaceae bacterium]|nr:phosphoglycerate dehydrogenase [Litorivicinaceae bacterium]MDB2424910.1 phosphoglycerate dehydrogenase [Litorivicinaceae bacterium]MDB3998017.1 phosphoglycerate dehydrogenase [Litorivicinus sp.]|tara:strand:- start:2158 stop:3324 length:1167 start_codon:yes stop_codon:yes gene_type:complete